MISLLQIVVSKSCTSSSMGVVITVSYMKRAIFCMEWADHYFSIVLLWKCIVAMSRTLFSGF